MVHCKACDKVMKERELFWDTRIPGFNIWCVECIRADNLGLDNPLVSAKERASDLDLLLDKDGSVEGGMELTLEDADLVVFHSDSVVWYD